MAKIVGNAVGIPNPQSDWNQSDATKADFIKNKPMVLTEEDILKLIGESGADGVGIVDIYSTMDDNTNSVVVIIQLSNGETLSFSVKNGEDGKDGKDGEDGVGILSIGSMENEKSTNINIEYSDGSMTTFDIPHGKDGVGIDNVYTLPYEGGRGVVLQMSNGLTYSFDVNDGYTPVKGTDYWTEEDKAEIKSYVDEAILGGAW